MVVPPRSNPLCPRKVRCQVSSMSAWTVTRETQPDSEQAPSQARHPCGSEQKKKPHLGSGRLPEAGVHRSWAVLVRIGPG